MITIRIAIEILLFHVRRGKYAVVNVYLMCTLLSVRVGELRIF